jgi:hypothetical protein
VILIHIGTACKMRIHRISVHASWILTFIFETPGEMDVELWFMNSDQNHFYIYLLGSLHYSAWKALANWKQKPFEIQYLILNYSNTKRKYNSASINFNELCIHSVYLDKKNMISYLCLVNFFRWAVDSIGLDPMNNNKEAVKLLPRFDRTGSFIRWTKLRTELQLKKKPGWKKWERHTLWITLFLFKMYSRNVPKIRDSRNQAKILTGNPAMRAAYETDANFSIYMHILAIHKLKHMSATNICRQV